MDWDEISNLHRGPAIDASHQVSVHLEMNLKNQPIRNKNHLWRPRLLMDRDKLSHLYRELPIDDTYQVSVHLAEGFQRTRLKCEVNGRQVMAKAHIAFAKVS
jgi:hypothetical protein